MVKVKFERSFLWTLALALVAACVAGLWTHSVLGGIIGWHVGTMVGAAFIAHRNKKIVTPYLFIFSALSLSAATVLYTSADGILVASLVLIGLLAGASGSQIEKENLDAA